MAARVVTFARASDIGRVRVAGQARERHGEMIGVDRASLKTRLHEARERVERKAATVNWT